MSMTRNSRTVEESSPGPRAVTAVAPGAARRTARTARGRSLLSYLVVPRPGDAVKALLMPAVFGLGVLAVGGMDKTTVVRAAIVLVVLEVLVYPARYQWNDIRGFAADQRHPARAERGRLPGPPQMARQRIMASTAVATARLGVAAGIALIPGLHLSGTVLGVIVGVFGVAAAYEALRSAATGHCEDANPAVTPVLVALWLAVGAGYAVRGMTGLAMAVDLREQPWLTLAATITLWAYGVAFVTSRWAVESLAFAELRGTRLRWTAGASHAREHLLALTRWLPKAVTPGDLTGPANGTTAGWAALRGRTPLTAPWNLALILAGAGAAVTGLLLTTPVRGAGMPLAFAALGGLAVLAAVALPRLRVPAVLAGAGAVLVAFVAAPDAEPVVAALPCTAVLLAYLHFSAQTLRSLSRPRRAIPEPLLRALAPAARIAVGHDTWRLLKTQDPAHG